MLDYNAYKIVHFIGLVLLFQGLGAIMLSRGQDGRAPRSATVLHGLGLLIMLIGGFGMLARLQIVEFPWPLWVFGKFGVWLLLGALPVLAKRGVVKGVAGVLLAAALAGLSAGLALYKPIL